MNIDKTMLIISGEGTGPGTIERYEGARTAKAIRSRLSRERTGGRWAQIWGQVDGGTYALADFIESDGTLALSDSLRTIPDDAIKINPAAQMGAKRSALKASASRENGKLGGRPVK